MSRHLVPKHPKNTLVSHLHEASLHVVGHPGDALVRGLDGEEDVLHRHQGALGNGADANLEHKVVEIEECLKTDFFNLAQTLQDWVR